MSRDPRSVSLTTRAVCRVFALTLKRRWATEEIGRRKLLSAKTSPEPPARLAERVRSRSVNGFAVHRVLPEGGIRSSGAVVYLHGGGYVSEIVAQHWSLIADLADATGRPVEVPVYGLAPQHDGLSARELGLTVLAELDREFGTRSSTGPIHLVGDSAGGGLALLLAQARRDLGAAAATGVVLMAPWLDLSMANPEVDALEPYDPWLSRAGLRPVAAAWAGGLALTDPRISPLFGSMVDLPPVEVFVGTRDITLCDARVLIDTIRAAGGSAGLHEAVGAPHVHPLLPIPEGRRARARLLATVSR